MNRLRRILCTRPVSRGVFLTTTTRLIPNRQHRSSCVFSKEPEEPREATGRR